MSPFFTPLSFTDASPPASLSSLNFETVQHDLSLQTLIENDEKSSLEYRQREEFLKLYDEEMREINARHNNNNALGAARKLTLNSTLQQHQNPPKTSQYSHMKSIFKAILFQENPVLMFYLAESIVTNKGILNEHVEAQFIWSTSERSTTHRPKAASNIDDLLVVLQKSIKYAFIDFVKKNFRNEENIESEVEHLTENLKLETNKDLLLVLLKWYKNVIERLLKEGDVVRVAHLPSTTQDETLEHHGRRMAMIAMAQYRCGCIEWRLGHHKQSLHFFEKSSPKILESAMNCFAFKFHGIGTVDQDEMEAVQILCRAIRDFPHDGRPFYYLGLCHELGRGIGSISYAQALENYEQAAQYLHRPALMHLSKWYLLNDPRRLYASTTSHDSSRNQMFSLLKESHSDTEHHNLARKEIPFSPKKAFRHLQTCAFQFHDPDAQYELGCHYVNGLYLKKDAQKALHWFHQSAKQDNHLSMHQLALLYSEGSNDDSVPVSLKKAYKWAERGAALGNVWCREFLSELREDAIDEEFGGEFTVGGMEGLDDALRHDARTVFFFLTHSTDMKQLVRQPALSVEHNNEIAAHLARHCFRVYHFIWCVSSFKLGAFRDSKHLHKSRLEECSLWVFRSKKEGKFGEEHLTEFVEFIHRMNCRSFSLKLHQRPEKGTNWILKCIESFFESHPNDQLAHYSIEVRSATKSEARFEALTSFELNQMMFRNERD